jgi:hypothetical protein
VAVEGARPEREFEETFRGAVRHELLQLDSDFADALDVAADAGISAAEVVARTLARIRQRDAAKVGRLGERIARVRERKGEYRRRAGPLASASPTSSPTAS